MLKRLKSDESGLTLIEITIVIVILGLLASFIAPRVLSAPDKAKVAKAKVEISALGNALEMYAIEVGDYPTAEQNLRALWKPLTRHLKIGAVLILPSQLSQIHGEIITSMSIPVFTQATITTSTHLVRTASKEAQTSALTSQAGSRKWDQ